MRSDDTFVPLRQPVTRRSTIDNERLESTRASLQLREQFKQQEVLIY